MSAPTPRKKKHAALHSSASAEWYTPPDLLREIRAFLGEIDLDPCPEPSATLIRLDGLAIPWRGRVYCNPPYGRQIGDWIAKAMSEPLDEIVLLVPARTDTAWFQACFEHTICFVRGRLRFSGAKAGAPFPSALVYRGHRGYDFCATFARRGVLVQAVIPARRPVPLRQAPLALAASA